MKEILLIIALAHSLFAQDLKDNYFYNGGKKIFLQSNTTLTRAPSREKKPFTTSNGSNITINRNIVVKLKNKEDLSFILSHYSLTLKKEYKNNVFLVSCENVEDTLNIANKLYEDNKTIYAQPNFISKVHTR